MNLLANENSPYLVQHAGNPVNWMPWSEEALKLAVKTEKPLFISIGYSSCHWCHVMEEESFSQSRVADVLNGIFVCIKVDREERPDVDSYYMKAAQALGCRGGWPLNIIADSTGHPIHAFTYLPEASLITVAERTESLWKARRSEVISSAAETADMLRRNLAAPLIGSTGTAEIMKTARKLFIKLSAAYDSKWGGFHSSPKFPTMQNLIYLLAYHRMNQSDKPIVPDMVINTLRRIHQGGIFDHLGGGMHRYSTDREWFLPHFEKMLYDQAMAVYALADASLTIRKPWMTGMADEIIRFVSENLTSPGGAFFSSMDADSDQGEGYYYTWSYRELKQHLTGTQITFLMDNYGVREEGNFKVEATGILSGRNILHRHNDSKPLPKLIRDILSRIRSKRARPATDNKILADWNGLMIAALAKAAAAFNRDDYLRKAETAADHICESMLSEEGDLFHARRNGRNSANGMLDDYAMFTMGLLELHSTTLENRWLKKALDLTLYMISNFTNTETKAFIDNSSECSLLPGDAVSIQDGAIPCGNAVALGNMVRIFNLTGNRTVGEAMTMLADYYAALLREYPMISPTAMKHLAERAESPVTAVVLGGAHDPLRQAMVEVVREGFGAETAILSADYGDSLLHQLAPFTASMTMKNGKASAWICAGGACSLPVESTDELRVLLREMKAES